MVNTVESLNFALRNGVVPVEYANLNVFWVLALYFIPDWCTWPWLSAIVYSLDYSSQYLFGYIVAKYVIQPLFAVRGPFGEAISPIPMIVSIVTNLVLYWTWLRPITVSIALNYFFS